MIKDSLRKKDKLPVLRLRTVWKPPVQRVVFFRRRGKRKR